MAAPQLGQRRAETLDEADECGRQLLNNCPSVGAIIGSHFMIKQITLFAAAAYTAIAAVPAIAVAPAAAGSVERFPPKDECLPVDGYFEFRQKFESIVQRRDMAAFLGLISPDISWTFGGEFGRDSFAAEWKLSTGKASPIWAELDKIIRLGCAGGEEEIVSMPHMFSQEVGTADRAASIALVLGPKVKLRAGPSTATAQKSLLNWEVVTIGDKDPSGKWTKVETGDGKSGYVRNDYLRGFLDYRIGFQRKENGWKIIYFTAGE
jgi:hypothetical protein